MNRKRIRCGEHFPRARRAAAASTFIVALWANSAAQALDIPVNCGMPAMQVGSISVNTSGSGVAGGFTSTVGTPPSLNAAAAACGEDHFNWFQVVTADNMPPNGPGGPGNPLTPPYIDPPLGGYGPPSTQWGDGLPWYWDEGADPLAGTPGFSDGYNLNDNLTGGPPPDTLHFEDFPGGAANSNVKFSTWLVSLNADGSLHEFHDGFSWMWSNPTGGAGTSMIINPLTPQQGQTLYNQLVPEPASIVLLALAACAMSCYRRRTAA
jgi:hypothetical protein